MKLTSEQALRSDIAILNSEIASLTAKRNILTQALAVIMGEVDEPIKPLTPTALAPEVEVPSGSKTFKHEAEEKVNRLGEQFDTERKTPWPKGTVFPPAQFQAYSAEQLYEAITTVEGDFTTSDLVRVTGRSKDTVYKYMAQLIDAGLVADTGRTKPGKGSAPLYRRTDQPAPEPSEHPTDSRGGVAKGSFTVRMLRDHIVTQHSTGQFTVLQLVDELPPGRTLIEKHLNELVSRDIVKLLRHDAGVNRNQKLYCYNSVIPPAPTEHPHEPTPESEAIGATTAGSIIGTNGNIKVSDTMIQGFINAAINQGWEVTWKDGNHLKFKSPSGRTCGVNAKPPSKQIGMVIKRDLKRTGLRLA